MGYINNNICVSWLTAQLEREYRAIDWSTIEEEDGATFVDVRLQATEHGGWLHVGDACFDTDHSGYWGAGSLHPGMDREELADLAQDLISQAAEMAAEKE